MIGRILVVLLSLPALGLLFVPALAVVCMATIFAITLVGAAWVCGLDEIWRSFWTIYASSRRQPDRDRRGIVRSMWTAFRYFGVVAAKRDVIAWNETILHHDDHESIWSVVEPDTISNPVYWVVPTRKGWLPAPWWGDRVRLFDFEDPTHPGVWVSFCDEAIAWERENL